MVLDFFLVVLDLLFDPVGGKAEGMMHIGIAIDRHKLVFVFRVGKDFDSNLTLALTVKIHRYRDGREAIEEVKQLLGLILELLLDIVIQMPMPDGDCHLHRLTSCSVPGVRFVDAPGFVIPLLVEPD